MGIYSSFAGRGYKPRRSSGLGGLQPFVPPTVVPPGTYDPGLDFQAENAAQGFSFNAQDADLQHARGLEDYTTALGQTNRNHDQALGALAQALGRAQQDYATSTGQVAQNYRNLGSRQEAAIYGSGQQLGGALAQSAQKRQANQATDQGRLDTSLSRFQQDNQTQTDQTNQSWRDLVGADGQSGSLGQAFQRGNENTDTALQRAATENLGFQNQIERAKAYSAEQAGLLPTRPEGTYATLPHGLGSYLFGGVPYGPGSEGNPFLQPLAKPSTDSVLGTGSLRGTGLDFNSPYYRRRRR